MASTLNISGSTTGNYTQLPNSLLSVYADEVLHAAQPILRFEAVAVKKQDLMVTPGQTIKFLKYASLLGTSALAETASLETTTLTNSEVSIAVQEHAQALQFSELLLRTSFHNVMGEATLALGRNYALNRERLIKNALLGSANVKYSQAGGAATSRANLLSNSTLDLDLIQDSTEFLATKKAPKFGGDGYICYVHPHQGTALRRTNGWLNVANYADPSRMINGEIGRIDDVRFVETTMIPKIPVSTQDIYEDNADTGVNTAVAANTNTDVYRAIMVGEYAVGIADAMDVELRDDGVQNFGRYRSLAWYNIMGAGLIESDHVVVLETA